MKINEIAIKVDEMQVKIDEIRVKISKNKRYANTNNNKNR